MIRRPLSRSIRASLFASALSLLALLAACGDDDSSGTPPPAGGAGTSAGGSSAGGAGGSDVSSAGAGGESNAAGAAGGATIDPIETTQGCVGKYTDLSTVADADRKIEGLGVAWTPACVEITAGQSLTWAVDYTTHPLRKGVKGDENAGSPNNPIPDTDSGSPVTVAFPTPGFYPFYCNYHATPDGKGMVGLVHVK